MRYLLSLLLLVLVAPVAAAEPTLDEIVAKTNVAAYYQGEDGRARVSMKITDPQGRERTRELTIMRKDASDGGEQKYLVYFHEPADVAKMTLIVHKKLDRDDDRWLYLPALDLEKRIAAADKRTSFAGSDFFYEDVSGRSPTLDEHVLLESTQSYFVLENTPRDPSSVEFSRYVMHIHKGTFLPMKVELFDKKNKSHRVMTVLEVAKVDGYPTVKKAQMEDVQVGSKTVITYRDIDYDLGIPDSAFGKRSLRRPPVKYMR